MEPGLLIVFSSELGWDRPGAGSLGSVTWGQFPSTGGPAGARDSSEPPRQRIPKNNGLILGQRELAGAVRMRV